jgi:hypothetical protein
MSNTNTGGPAFPYEERNGEGNPVRDYFGMTLRDYFAAKAMQSAYLHFSADADVAKHWTTEGIAESAYAMADAMLEAREA